MAIKNLKNKTMCEICETLKIKKELVLLDLGYCVSIVNEFPIGRCSLLIAPKRHLCSLEELNIQEFKCLLRLVELASAIIINRALGKGINTFLNEGDLIWDKIDHLHFHLVVRSMGDGLEKLEKHHSRPKISEKELMMIRNCFQNQ